MWKYNAKQLASFQRILTEFGIQTKATDAALPAGTAYDPIISEGRIADYKRFFSHVRTELDRMTLPSSMDKAERILRMLDSPLKCKRRDYIIAITELWERIEDEIGHQLLLQVSPSKVSYYEQPLLFGKEVYDAFPSAIVDIEEAGTCYALDRNVASVMHLQRAMEGVLRTLGAEIGVDIAQNRTWDAVLQKIDPELRKGYTDKSDFFKQHEQECAEATALLRAVKIAWRNPSMHVEAIYDEAKALEVLNAVKAFMRHLATFLKKHPETV